MEWLSTLPSEILQRIINLLPNTISAVSLAAASTSFHARVPLLMDTIYVVRTDHCAPVSPPLITRVQLRKSGGSNRKEIARPTNRPSTFPIEKYPHLTRLCLIKWTDGMMLSNKLPCLHRLSRLRLIACTIDQEELQSIMKIKTLTSLNLSRTSLTEIDLGPFRGNTMLKSLNLSRTKLRLVAVTQLFSMVEDNYTLTSLKLDQCLDVVADAALFGYTEKEVDAFSSALFRLFEQNSTLQKLSLAENRQSDELFYPLIPLLDELLSANKGLQYLNLSNSMHVGDAEIQIRRALKSRQPPLTLIL